MAAKPVSKLQRIETLKQQEAVLKARRIALQNRLQQDQRKRDTRKKIMVGAVALTHASRDPDFAQSLRRALQQAITKTADRELLRDWLTPSPDRSTQPRKTTAGKG